MPVGALAHFGYAEESAAAPGTLVAISRFFDPTSADIDDQFPREAIPTMREDRAQIRSVSKITEVKGNWSAPLYYNALPFFMKMALGDVVSAVQGATAAYLHTFDGTKVLPSFSTEVAYDTAGAKQAAGCKVDKLSIAAKAGEHAEASCDFLGLSTYKNAAAVVAGLPADDNLAVFSHAVVKFDAVSNLEVISMELAVENNLEAINTLNGTAFSTRIAEGVRAITCGLEMDFLDQAMYDYSRNATKVAVMLEFTSPVLAAVGYPYKMTFDLPNVKFANVSAPVEADGIISQKLDTVPLFDSVAGYDTQWKVWNTDTGYADVA